MTAGLVGTLDGLYVLPSATKLPLGVTDVQYVPFGSNSSLLSDESDIWLLDGSRLALMCYSSPDLESTALMENVPRFPSHRDPPHYWPVTSKLVGDQGRPTLMSRSH